MFFMYCEIIFIRLILCFIFRGLGNPQILDPMKHLFTLVILNNFIIWNPQIQVSTNMSNVVKPWSFHVHEHVQCSKTMKFSCPRN